MCLSMCCLVVCERKPCCLPRENMRCCCWLCYALELLFLSCCIFVIFIWADSFMSAGSFHVLSQILIGVL